MNTMSWAGLLALAVRRPAPASQRQRQLELARQVAARPAAGAGKK